MSNAADADAPGREDGNGGEGAPAPGRLDLRDVKRLLLLMERHDLSEMELEDAGRRVHFRRGGVASAAAHAAAPAPAAAAPVPAVVPAPVPAPASRGTEIRSPMVGTFYRASSPESAPFVEVGDPVRKGSVLCIIEAMKVMNEIKAEIEGELVAVLVQNGEAVEFDQPLFVVRPAGGAGAAG